MQVVEVAGKEPRPLPPIFSASYREARASALRMAMGGSKRLLRRTPTEGTDMNSYIEGLEESRVIQSTEYNLVALLQPRIFIDGNTWCVLYGENLQDGVAGFGETPYRAVLGFSAAWHQPAKKEPT